MLHHFTHFIINESRVLATFSGKRCKHVFDGLHDLGIIDAWLGKIRGSLSSKFTSTLSERDQIRQRVPSKTVRSVKSRCSFTACIETGNSCFLRFSINTNSAHDVVRCWTNFHGVLGDVNTSQFHELVVHRWKFLLDGFLSTV